MNSLFVFEILQTKNIVTKILNICYNSVNTIDNGKLRI